MAGADGEVITEGLDGLRDRLAEYADLGAKFTKWRAVITIGDGIPTRRCIEANAHALARFATLSQEAGLVPIVEPEVLMDGDHDIDACYEATTETLREVYYELGNIESRSRAPCSSRTWSSPARTPPTGANAEQVAEMTVNCFLEHRSRRCAGRGVPVGRTVGRRGHGQPRRHQPLCRDDLRAVGAELLLRARPAGGSAQGVGRGGREHPGGTGGLLPSSEGHVGRAAGRVHWRRWKRRRTRAFELHGIFRERP